VVGIQVVQQPTPEATAERLGIPLSYRPAHHIIPPCGGNKSAAPRKSSRSILSAVAETKHEQAAKRRSRRP
jgi:hypothetical protein